MDSEIQVSTWTSEGAQQIFIINIWNRSLMSSIKLGMIIWGYKEKAQIIDMLWLSPVFERLKITDMLETSWSKSKFIC